MQNGGRYISFGHLVISCPVDGPCGSLSELVCQQGCSNCIKYLSDSSLVLVVTYHCEW